MSSTYQVKLLVVGGVSGKSALVDRFITKEFHYQNCTIGVQFHTKTITLQDDDDEAKTTGTIKFTIWDTTGQTDMAIESIKQAYLKGTNAAIAVYDIRDLDSFEKAKFWVKELQRRISPNVVIALAGNMADLASKRNVECKVAEDYARENGLLFMETSAKTGMNVDELFTAIGKKTFDDILDKEAAVIEYEKYQIKVNPHYIMERWMKAMVLLVCGHAKLGWMEMKYHSNVLFGGLSPLVDRRDPE